MSPQFDASKQRRTTYTALSGTFFAIFTIFSWIQGRKGKQFELKPYDLTLVGLASYRLGRLVAYDKVAEPYRRPFCETVPDPTGAGDTVMPKGEGWRRAIGELISCPICAGTWIAAGLVYGLNLLPGPTRLLLAIMSSIGVGELFNSLTEALCWSGQASREMAGTESMRKKAG